MLDLLILSKKIYMNIAKFIFYASSASLFSLSISNYAHAGLFDDNEARQAILDMRTQINQYKQEQDNKYTKLQTAILSLQSQIETLQTQRNYLSGQSEITSNELAKLKENYQLLANSYTDRLNKNQQDIDEIKQNLQNINAYSKSGTESQANAQKEKIFDTSESFNIALKYFNSGDFKKSAESFNLLLSDNSNVSLMPLIVYYLGNSYYALQKYKPAAVQLQNFINNYAEHEKLPDVYLTLASMYIETGDKLNAKRTLEYIVKNYSGSSVGQIAKKRLNELKK